MSKTFWACLAYVILFTVVLAMKPPTPNEHQLSNSDVTSKQSTATSTADNPTWYKEHQEALKEGCDTYKDPDTGYIVFTENFHLRSGKCCGSGCRHCPYNHINVPKSRETEKATNRSSIQRGNIK